MIFFPILFAIFILVKRSLTDNVIWFNQKSMVAVVYDEYASEVILLQLALIKQNTALSFNIIIKRPINIFNLVKLSKNIDQGLLMNKKNFKSNDGPVETIILKMIAQSQDFQNTLEEVGSGQVDLASASRALVLELYLWIMELGMHHPRQSEPGKAVDINTVAYLESEYGTFEVQGWTGFPEFLYIDIFDAKAGLEAQVGRVLPAAVQAGEEIIGKVSTVLLDLEAPADAEQILQHTSFFECLRLLPGRFNHVHSWNFEGRWLMVYRLFEASATREEQMYTDNGFLGLDANMDIFLDASILGPTQTMYLKSGTASLKRTAVPGAITIFIDEPSDPELSTEPHQLLSEVVFTCDQEYLRELEACLKEQAQQLHDGENVTQQLFNLPLPPLNLRAFMVLANPHLLDTEILHLDDLSGNAPFQTGPKFMAFATTLTSDSDFQSGSIFVRLDPAGPDYSMVQFQNIASSIRKTAEENETETKSAESTVLPTTNDIFRQVSDLLGLPMDDGVLTAKNTETETTRMEYPVLKESMESMEPDESYHTAAMLKESLASLGSETNPKDFITTENMESLGYAQSDYGTLLNEGVESLGHGESFLGTEIFKENMKSLRHDIRYPDALTLEENAGSSTQDQTLRYPEAAIIKENMEFLEHDQSFPDAVMCHKNMESLEHAQSCDQNKTMQLLSLPTFQTTVRTFGALVTSIVLLKLFSSRMKNNPGIHSQGNSASVTGTDSPLLGEDRRRSSSSAEKRRRRGARKASHSSLLQSEGSARQHNTPHSLGFHDCDKDSNAAFFEKGNDKENWIELEREFIKSLNFSEDATPFLEEKLCVVCMVNSKDALLAPCGHICCCFVCATSMANGNSEHSVCPVCRGKITSVFKFYYT